MFTSGFPYQETFDGMSPVDGRYDLRVIVASNIPARDPMFEYFLEYGRNTLNELFRAPDQPYRAPQERTFLMFPERHLSVHEQRWMGLALEAAGFKRVDCITSSPFVVQEAGSLAKISSDNYLMDRDGKSWWFADQLDQRLNDRVARPRPDC